MFVCVCAYISLCRIGNIVWHDIVWQKQSNIIFIQIKYEDEDDAREKEQTNITFIFYCIIIAQNMDMCPLCVLCAFERFVYVILFCIECHGSIHDVWAKMSKRLLNT